MNHASKVREAFTARTTHTKRSANVIGRDESGLGLRAAIVAGLAGTTLLAGNAIADFNDAVVVR
jgi:hypothetical protein